MFDDRYEQEYELSIKELREAMDAYKPFFEAKDKWLSNEEVEVGDRLTKAQERWREVKAKYFKLSSNEK